MPISERHKKAGGLFRRKNTKKVRQPNQSLIGPWNKKEN